MTAFDYEALSPGIRETVRWLRGLGLETVDSGDGSNFSAGMECASPEPMVAITVDRDDMVTDAMWLWRRLEARGFKRSGPVRVECSYSPNDGRALILVLGLNDERLAAAKKFPIVRPE